MEISVCITRISGNNADTILIITDNYNQAWKILFVAPEYQVIILILYRVQLIDNNPVSKVLSLSP